ncbi:MAG: hypothetical protein JST27_04930 [Bacteroidetes bacterium]|nr:hypothetical protein [Bacteroidota bacterium]
MMTDEELIVILDGNQAFLTHEMHLPLSKIGLPDYIERFKAPVIWKFRILKHIEAEKRITALILSYGWNDATFSNRQKEIFQKIQIESISFSTISTSGLLQSTNGNIIFKSSSNSATGNSSQKDSTAKAPDSTVKFHRPAVILPTIKEPVPRTIVFPFTEPIKNVVFREGFVTATKRVPELARELEFQIENAHVREEYDAVKNYIGNVLQTKKISVTATIELLDGQIVSVNAVSPEIAKINDSMLEGLRLEFVKDFTRPTVLTTSDQPLFTLDELFKGLTEGKIKSDAFYDDDRKVVEDLIGITDSKHYHHLRFLSSRHLHTTMKLRFSIRPFSFVFLIEGTSKYYIVWETLHTQEATYIWRVAKDKAALKAALSDTSAIIGGMKAKGKQQYITTKAEDFNRIYHDYSDLANGFRKWKTDLETLLDEKDVLESTQNNL